MVKRKYVRTAVRSAMPYIKKAAGGVATLYYGNKKRSVVVKRKVSRSSTKTRTKKKFGSSGDDQHSGIGTRNLVLRLHPKLKGVTLGTWKFAQNYAGTLSGPAGEQAVQIMMGLCLTNQFTTDTATPNFGQIRANLFDLNTSRANTGSTLVPVVAKPSTDRMAVFHVRVNMMFTNLETVSTVLTLYFVTPKRDTPDLADTCWTKALTGEGLTKATRTRAAAGTYGATTAGTGSSVDVFAKPTNLAYFKTEYKVLKVIKLKMAAGATEEVNVSAHINKIVKLQMLLNSTNECFKGLNIQMLAVAYGQVVHDTTAAGTFMTTAATKIGMVQTATYTCGLTKALSNKTDDFFTNQQIATGVAVANQGNIDIADVISGVDQA